MDFKFFITFVAEHSIVVIGTTLALFFTTCMILLIRSIGAKEESSTGGDVKIDVTEIESAMKRVLAIQPLSVVGRSADAPNARDVAGGSSPDGEQTSGAQVQLVQDLQVLVQSRDAQIEKLSKELSEAQAAAQAGASAKADASSDSSLSDELQIYKAKIEELQARLAEYEIIEDDIADLSMFKEENARMKEELAQLKANSLMAPVRAASAATAPGAPQEPAVAPPVLAVVPAGEPVTAPVVEAAKETPAPSAAPTEAHSEAPTDPLAGAADAEKMISEVESLTAAAAAAGPEGSAESALEELLDTDKLLAEVDSLKDAQKTPAAENSGGDILAAFDKAAQG